MNAFFIFLSALSISVGARAADQIPPLTVDPSEDCHIQNARPQIDAKAYALKKYEMTTLEKMPLKIRESVELNKDERLDVDQRGCEDVYFKFTISDERKASSDKARIEHGLSILKSLKLTPHGFLSSNGIAAMVTAVTKQLKAKPKAKEFLVCLLRVEKECITDVNVAVSPDKVEFTYVDRP